MSTQVLIRQDSSALEAWVRLLRGHAATRRSLDAELQGGHGLTVNDYEALLLLSRADGNHMRRVDLARGFQPTASGGTRALEGLARGGLVARSTGPAHRRGTFAGVTDARRRKVEGRGHS